MENRTKKEIQQESMRASVLLACEQAFAIVPQTESLFTGYCAALFFGAQIR